MNPLTFFAHVALSNDESHLSPCGATANLLIEVSEQALRSDGDDQARTPFAKLSASQQADRADGIGRAAVLDFLNLEAEFNNLPVRRIIDFNLADTPSYISISPAATRTLPNQSKVWRLAECESDKLRTQPLS